MSTLPPVKVRAGSAAGPSDKSHACNDDYEPQTPIPASSGSPKQPIHPQDVSSLEATCLSSIREFQTQFIRPECHSRSTSHGSSGVGSLGLDSENLVPFELPHFSTVSLLTVWVVDCTIGFSSLVLCDFYASQYPEFPLFFFLVLGSQMNLLAGVFVYFLGREQFGALRYRLYQPFSGGVRFVTLQCFGVMCVAASQLIIAAYVRLFDPVAQHTHGFLSTTGGLALFGNILILLSLRYFDLQDKSIISRGESASSTERSGGSSLSTSDAALILNFLRRRPNAESALEVAMLIAQSVFSVVAIQFPDLKRGVFAVNLGIALVCGCISLFSVGYRHSLGFVSFRVRMHRTFDTALLWLSRFVYVIAVFAHVLLAIQADARAVQSSVVLAVQGLSFVSCIALLMFVRTIRYEASSDTPSVPSSVFELGGMVAVAAVFMVGCLNTLIFLYLRSFPEGLEEKVEGTEWTYQGVMRLVAQLTQLLSLLPTPLVYVTGVIMHNDRFRMLSRYRQAETLPVLFLQVLSSLLYIAAMVSFMLFLSTDAFGISSVEAVTSTLSVFCMTCAVRLYSSIMLTSGRSATVPSETSRPITEALPPGKTSVLPSATQIPEAVAAAATAQRSESAMAAAVRTPEAPRTDMEFLPSSSDDISDELAHLAYIINGEMIISYLLSLTSVLLRLIVDISQHRVWGDVQLPQRRLLMIADVCFIVSVPLAHCSGRDKGIKIFNPFSGSGSFVALQVVGWMLYAMFVIAIIFGTIVETNAQSLPTEWHAAIEQGPVLYALFGLLETLPVALITFSIAVEARLTRSAAFQQCLAKESFFELRRCMREALENKTNEQRVVAQLAFQTLMTAALHSFDLPCPDNLLRIYKDPEAARPSPLNTGEARTQASGSQASSSDSEDHMDGDNANEEPTTSDWGRTGADLLIRHRRMEAARVIVILLCCASATFFVIAAFTAQVVVLSLAAAVTAMLSCTTSCVGVHAGYGMIVHEHSLVYSSFMPFRGGSPFIIRQMAGWGCYAGAFLITLISSIESAEVSAVAMLIAALLSVASQVFIFTSIPLFSDKRGSPSFLEVNGEGIVALLTFTSAIAFGRAYASVLAFFGKDTQHYIHYGGDDGVSRWTRVPFVLTMMSLSMAVPCTLVALSRTSRRWNRRIRSSTAAAEEKHYNQQSLRLERQRVMLAKGISNLIEVLVILFGTFAPLSIGFLVYYFSTHYTPRLVRVLESYIPVCFACILATVVLSMVPYATNVAVPPFVVTLRSTILTWILYGVPVLAGCTLLIPALVAPRHSTIFLAAATFVLTLLGNFKKVRLLVKIAVYAVIGYLTYNKYVWYLSVGPSWLMARAAAVHLLDCLLLGFWLWYIPLYTGKPYHTGSQRSLRFTEFARNFLFADAVRYFNFQIILDDPSVSLRDEGAQYFFSYHPHGVFPGTALFAPHTAEWARKIGTNAKRYVSMHVASIIFNVPLVRDFNLRLGALSVSRRSLEASLKRGNSVMVVTGGQAEMLHTSLSKTKMTIITQHTGFIRLAVASRVKLVPVLCFAENNVLGLLQVPSIQRLSLKYLGFPFPTIPFGPLGLPVPFRTPLTLVVGPPLDIPANADENNPDDVKQLSDAYFAALKELFYRRRAEAGYPDMELVLLNEKEEALKRREARAANGAVATAATAAKKAA